MSQGLLRVKSRKKNIRLEADWVDRHSNSAHKMKPSYHNFVQARWKDLVFRKIFKKKMNPSVIYKAEMNHIPSEEERIKMK